MKRFISLLAVLFMTGVAAFAAEPQTTHKLALPDSLQQKQLGILGASLKVRDANSWIVTAKEGKSLGILVSSEIVGKRFEGYMGPTPVFILIEPQNKIKAIVAGYNEDTPEYFEMAADEIFPKWVGLDAKAGEKAKVDAVSGATYSSNALIINIINALEAYNASKK